MSALYTSLLELAEQRKSCRHFTAEPVSDDAVEQILAVAARAPFASGRSNWKVARVQDPQVIAALAAQVRNRAEALCADLDAETAPFFRRYAQSFTFFETAPLLLIPYCRETSTMKSTVSSRSSENLFMYGAPILAVTFQSIVLTSSPTM